MLPKLHSIGRVAGKHGFSGDISLILNPGIETNCIQKGNFIFVEFDGKGVPFLIEHYRPNAGLIKLLDVNSADEAAALDGKKILIESTGADELPEADDIQGYSVIIGGNSIGTVDAIEEFPAGYMLKIMVQEQEILIPWVDDWIVEIDEDARTIELELPDGLLEL